MGVLFRKQQEPGPERPASLTAGGATLTRHPQSLSLLIWKEVNFLC